MKIFSKWLVCLAVLFVAAYAFPESVHAQGGASGLLAAATVLFVVNLFIKPLLQLIALPVTLITFGLFSVVVNALAVLLTDALLPALRIDGFFLCVAIALLISAGNFLISVSKHRA